MITNIKDTLCLVQKDVSVFNKSSDQETVLALDVHLDHNSAMIKIQEQKLVTPST